MTTAPDVDVMEVTLRDGSYLVDFQFTGEDTATIGGALQAVGFRWIEVGHGVGLGASRSTSEKAAASDEEYLEAAAATFHGAKWGMFFIPGVANAEDLRLAAAHGMKFVRIGTNVTQSEQARPFVELAKELGLIVSYNAMKSYAVAPPEFAAIAANVGSWGTDYVCLVDSAGSFDPQTVAAYLRATRETTDVAIGFHGHDNLAMAIANTLRAVEEGASLVDTSLQGMGRSAGNAITEVLVGILQQRGLMRHIDLKATMDVGIGLISPLLGRRLVDPIAVTAGLARFHSSFLPKVQQYARRYAIDVRDLIVRLTQEDQIGAPDALLEKLSRDLAEQKMSRALNLPRVAARATNEDALVTLLRQLRSRSLKSGKHSALNVVRSSARRDASVVSPNVHSTATHVIGVVTVSTSSQLDEAIATADGKVDVIFLDVDRSFPTDSSRVSAKKSKLLTYLDSVVWVSAIEDQVVRIAFETLDDVTVTVLGEHPKSHSLRARLRARRANVIDAIDTNATIVVAWPDEPLRDVDSLRKGAYVIDAAIGGLSPEALAAARDLGAQILRVNIWPALGAALAAAHESARVFEEAFGWSTLDDVAVVGGGAMGRAGDVIVDSVRRPTRVIGVADGRGGVVFDYEGEAAERVRRVSAEITQRQIGPQLD